MDAVLERVPPLLTVPDVAQRLQVPESSVRKWLREGRLDGMRLGGDKAGWRVSEEDLARFIRERRAGAD